jgi:predicted TIM-barrel fold metal-dependent hydrolase
MEAAIGDLAVRRLAHDVSARDPNSSIIYGRIGSVNDLSVEDQAVAPREVAQMIQSKLVIDSDVHPMTRRGWPDIKRYVPRSWHERLEIAFRDTTLSTSRTPSVITDAQKGASFSADAEAPDGSRPGSSPEFTREQLLEGHGVDCAILVPFESLTVVNLGNTDETNVLARAYNDYMIETWLPVDDRYQLAIGLPPRDPEAAVQEIRRLAGTPGVVACVFPLAEQLSMGHARYHSIYEAAEEARLPILTHTGQGSLHGIPRKSATGPHTTYTIGHSIMCEIALSNVTSLVFEGVTVRFPSLKFVFVEWGFSWLAHLMWRMDAEWRSLHAETPWIVEPPSHYVNKSMRFTTQPIDQPHRKADLAAIVDMIGGDEILLFASDYPHWDNEFPNNALNGLSEETQRRIFHENAQATYPRLKVVVPAGA